MHYEQIAFLLGMLLAAHTALAAPAPGQLPANLSLPVVELPVIDFDQQTPDIFGFGHKLTVKMSCPADDLNCAMVSKMAKRHVDITKRDLSSVCEPGYQFVSSVCNNLREAAVTCTKTGSPKDREVGIATLDDQYAMSWVCLQNGQTGTKARATFVTSDDYVLWELPDANKLGATVITLKYGVPLHMISTATTNIYDSHGNLAFVPRIAFSNIAFQDFYGFCDNATSCDSLPVDWTTTFMYAIAITGSTGGLRAYSFVSKVITD